MTTNETIKKALSILNGHDFYYMMVDYGYASAEASAKSSMRHFVEVTNTLPSELRLLLRDLWIATYNWCACFRPMWTAEDHKEKEDRKNELQAKVNIILAA